MCIVKNRLSLCSSSVCFYFDSEMLQRKWFPPKKKTAGKLVLDPLLVSHLVVFVVASTSAAASSSSASSPVIWVVASLFALSSIVSIIVRCLHTVVIVCIDVCVIVCVTCCLHHCQMHCHPLCYWGVGESLRRPVYLWGGGRWCDIPMTGPTMARTYSNKQRDPSK
jgi:hypothetical protein